MVQGEVIHVVLKTQLVLNQLSIMTNIAIWLRGPERRYNKLLLDEI
jgi:hypothetical protein